MDAARQGISIERVLETIDSSMPGGHAVVRLDGVRVPAVHILGELDEGFRYAQVRLAPARLTHTNNYRKRSRSLSRRRTP